ncbi:MAG: alpha/beta hydrolase-fold protein [Bacteroidia bacterium]|nr:alpha/beta hydrolase-fold protein [Bacteroidia bacterium]
MKQRLLSFILISLGLAVTAGAQEIASISPRNAIVSPEITAEGVTFRFPGEYVTEVWLDASCLDEPLLMGKRNGVWEATVIGVRPDLYTYTFIADGVRTFDPSNPVSAKDGNVRYSMFKIEGERTRNYQECGKHGSVDCVWYDSRISGEKCRMTVYTPYGYESSTTRRYPVLYLLPGEAGDEESWLSMGKAAEILDNLIREGKAVPMIVVMPDAPDFTDKDASLSFESSLLREIIPFVESRYRVEQKKSRRCISGPSYAGTFVIDFVRHHTDIFDFVCPLSFVIDDPESLKGDFLRIKYSKVKLFWMGCGSLDGLSLDGCGGVHDVLNEINLFHTYYKNVGGHDWSSWRLYLTNFLPMIFRYYED